MAGVSLNLLKPMKMEFPEFDVRKYECGDPRSYVRKPLIWKILDLTIRKPLKMWFLEFF